MTRDDVWILHARISAFYGRRKAEPHVVEAWTRALDRYPAQKVFDALDDWVDLGRSGPNVADLIGLIRDKQPPTPPIFTAEEHQMQLSWEGPTDEGRLLAKRAKEILHTTPAWTRHVDPEEEA